MHQSEFCHVDSSISKRVCKYISEEIRPKFKSNLEMAGVADVDEKTIRLILAGDYNLSLELFERICDAGKIKMSTVLRRVGA